MSQTKHVHHAAAVAIGGGIGANLRYWIGLLLPFHPLNGFPAATLAVNLIGACFLGWLTAWLAHRPWVSPIWKLIFGTGLAGAITTFSTFTLETIQFIEAGRWGMAVVYQLLSIASGVGAAWACYHIGSLYHDPTNSQDGE